jgi:hypothetical protein
MSKSQLVVKGDKGLLDFYLISGYWYANRRFHAFYDKTQTLPVVDTAD